MKKIISTIILTVAILLGILPTKVLAVEEPLAIRYGTSGILNITLPTTANYYTYGTSGTDGKSATQTASNAETLPDSNWNWAVQKVDTIFDGSTYNYTMTLNNFNSNTTGWSGGGKNVGDCIRFSNLNLRIFLKGESTLVAPSARGTGIISETNDSKLLISGDGILNSSGNLGISAFDVVTISSGTINSNGYLWGLNSKAKVEILGGKVTATNSGEDTNSVYYGIRSEGSIVISGGTVTVKTVKNGSSDKAFNVAPNLSGYLNGYQWNINENNPSWTGSTVTEFTNSGDPVYVQIRPDLAVTDSDSYDVPSGMVGTAMTSIDVSAGAAGGKAPYTFSLEDNPSWLSISEAGIISGTRPLTASAATTATIKVTDSQTPAISKTITIKVGAVTVTPPATGDNSNLGSWIVIALFSVIGLASILLAKQNRRDNHRNSTEI